MATPTFENGGIVCDGEDKTFTITVNPTAQVDQSLDQVVCNGDTTSIVEFVANRQGEAQRLMHGQTILQVLVFQIVVEIFLPSQQLI